MKRKFLILPILVFAMVWLIATGCYQRKANLEVDQAPSPPFPYHSEEVTFPNNTANITLAGTLTLPEKEGIFPAVVLITGSGPQNRDEEVYGHKPFLVISDYLTRNGIAVLRYDDRGYGKSTGNFQEGTSLDFSTDVESAIQFLKTRKEIRKDKIGLIGHSDGAMIAPMVAARSTDVGFMVLLAGPGLPGGELLTNRQEYIERTLGLSEVEIQKSKKRNEEVFAIIGRSGDPEQARAELGEYVKKNFREIPDSIIPPGMSKEQFIAKEIDLLSSPWFYYFLKYDPSPVLQQVSCPVLALNGSKDVQVPAKENLMGIANALKEGGNDNVTIKEIPGLNHFFQECDTGMPEEYATIDQAFSPAALVEISNWVVEHCKE